MEILEELKQELKKYENPDKEKFKYFHKTNNGDYAEKDVFIGITVPNIRKVAKIYYKNVSFNQIEQLLQSKYHEYRLTALIILTYQMKTNNENIKKNIFDFYLNNTKYINGWDLVDLSSHDIIGEYLVDKQDERKILYKLANSKNMWEQRISIVSTWQLIRNNQYNDTINISKILLNNENDLIQKAVGWMLREVGKKDFQLEYNFLKENYKQMPRTMLRYSIEKFPEEIRLRFLKGNI